MRKKIGIVRFLGTSCEHEVARTLRSLGRESEFLWYQNRFQTSDYEALILPGGASYGDALRAGALSARTPVMESVREASDLGVPILGISNGFQILCESQILEGAFLQNQGLLFQDKWVDMEIESTGTPWTQRFQQGEVIQLPMAHGEGRFYASPESLKQLQDQEQILCSYKKNPNGSVYDIAGILNKNKNVAALMPHPEWATASWMGSSSGRRFFEWIA